MAKADFSIHPVVLKEPFASSCIGPAVYSGVLDFTSAQATSGALTQARALLTKFKDVTHFVVQAVPVDADCYFATGTTPDCTATEEASATSARVRRGVGQVYEQVIGIGDKIAAKAVS
jgi:hypothetical protein